MVGFPVFEDITIQSKVYPYRVYFRSPASAWTSLVKGKGKLHVIIDERVHALYRTYLSGLLQSGTVLSVAANENEKCLDALNNHVRGLLANKVQKRDLLVGIGGGVIQDITGFLASTIHRGLDWKFIPTTLLAQADSCIGSKNGINVGDVKNILGTFFPPREIFIDHHFLSTLQMADLQSGIGEILKANAIDGPERFDDLSRRLVLMTEDIGVLLKEVYQALLIKKEYIERDEFDTDERRLFNYGHTFGHALEAGTDFAIPHGLAVSAGMDMANYMSKTLGLLKEQDYIDIHSTLRQVYSHSPQTALNFETFLSAFASDKKAIGNGRVQIIIPNKMRNLIKKEIQIDEKFSATCGRFLDGWAGITRVN